MLGKMQTPIAVKRMRGNKGVVKRLLYKRAKETNESSADLMVIHLVMRKN